MTNDARVAAMTTELVHLQARIADAANREDALELAIKAAELCMQALKLATDKRQKADLSSTCHTLLTEAERIKKSPQWQTTSTISGSTLSELSLLDEPINLLDEPPLATTAASSTEATPCPPVRATSPSVRATSSPPATAASSPPVKTTPPHPATSSQALGKPLSKPQFTSLAGPISDRKLSKSEQILLLKSSKVNGSTFPPWSDAPSPMEFTLEPGAAQFVDGTVFRLSTDQLESFDAWKPAKEALPPPAWFPDRSDGPVMNAEHKVDLVQDAATDCSVVAGLCAGVARAELGNEKLLPDFLFPYDYETMTPEMSANGKYILRLNFNGCWRKVVIDDRLPVSKTARMLHVLDRQNPALLWPALVEKAYLKVRGGYDFPGSSSCTDLWTLIGWIPEQIFLQEEDIMPDELWMRLSNAFRFGDVLMTIGTGSMSPRAEKELGLEGQHDYAILNMSETNGEKQLLLKNPWAEGKGWRGVRKEALATESAGTEGSSSLLQDGGETFAFAARSTDDPDHLAPGTFWISLEHVFQHFENIYVNWNPTLFKYRQDIHFSWDLRSSENAPGCFVDNPQFSLKTEGGVAIWLLLSRHFKDNDVNQATSSTNDGVNPDALQSTADSGYFPRPPKDGPLESGVQTRSESSALGDLAHGWISLYVYDEAGNRVYNSKLDTVERGAFVSSPQMLLRWRNPSKSTYTVVVEQMDLPTSQYTFTLSAFSRKRVELDHANKKYDYTAKLKSAWTKATAGGNLQSPLFSRNPQFKLTVPKATSLTVLLQVPDGSVVSNVVLLHGRGKRMHSVRTRDVLANSGLYEKHCAFVEVKDMDAGSYTIACSTFEPYQEAGFELRVDSEVGCELRLIPNEGAGLVSVELAQAGFGPTVNRLAAPVVPRKLVRINIVAKFLRAFGSYDKAGFRAQTRSPLRVTLEMGRAAHRRILVASSNGEYSDDEAGVRTEEIDVKPEMLHQGDMWLVLDRLSGPATGSSEFYQVELFCDSMNAVSVGVWRNWDP